MLCLQRGFRLVQPWRKAAGATQTPIALRQGCCSASRAPCSCTLLAALPYLAALVAPSSSAVCALGPVHMHGESVRWGAGACSPGWARPCCVASAPPRSAPSPPCPPPSCWPHPAGLQGAHTPCAPLGRLILRVAWAGALPPLPPHRHRCACVPGACPHDLAPTTALAPPPAAAAQGALRLGSPVEFHESITYKWRHL